jgi:hypothetical protein
MKKTFALLLVLVTAAALLVGCAPKSPATPSASPSVEPTAPETSTPATGNPVKTGLAIVTSIAKSTDAGESEGLAQADSVIVAVTVDADGKITDCVIDTAQSKANFDAAGKITTPLDTEFKTKNELGDAYGMKKASSIGKEWNEQAAALADYVIGKTAAEVKGIAIDEQGYAADSDLKASVTVHVNDYVDAIVKAVENAKDLGASAGDKLSVGTVTSIAKSTDVTADAAGLIQFYSTYAAITRDSAGVITSCIIDASQSNINFDANGKITTDLTAAPKTKNELGDAYGMKKASSIGKEWNEQAAAFAAYVTGKTPAEVAGIAVSEGYAADGDLKASVTVHITDFQAVIAKAAA